jgi:hypothetical protein
MLGLFSVGEGTRQGEVVDAFKLRISSEYLPALLMLAGRLQRDEALEECAKFIPPPSAGLYVVFRSIKTKAEVCVDAVAAAAGNRVAAEMLRSDIEELDQHQLNDEPVHAATWLRSDTEELVPEAHQLMEKADGRTLVEVLAPEYSWALLAFMLLAAVGGRCDAVRLHGLWGSAAYGEPLARRLFRAVYENCDDLNSEGYRLALVKLYYLHI